MKLIVCNSGSDGNTYLLNSETDCLVLDCGVDLKTVKTVLGFKVNHIKFAICTHAHRDHSEYIPDYLKMGIKVLMPEQVKESYKNNYLAVSVKPMKRIFLDGFFVTPLEVPHDEDITCYAYIIEREDFGKLLYLTDCMYCKYVLRKAQINHFLCECNYIQSLVNENYEKALRNRVLKTHMELQTVIDFLKANATDRLKTVTLCHLSDRNANAEEMLAEVQKVVPWANVSVARAGLEIELTEKCPF